MVKTNRKNYEIPILGKNIEKWSDLDFQLPKLDLNIELFQRQNVWIASFVIIGGILNADKQYREELFRIIPPNIFNSKSLCKFLFEKISIYFNEADTLTESLLETWIPEYIICTWGESNLDEKTIYSNQANLRQIINFFPTKDQMKQAIELRKNKMEREKNRL